MSDNDKKTVVFYHSPCLDGSAAAWMAYKKYGDEATYVGINHDGPDAVKAQILEHIDENTDAVFVDYSPYTAIMDTLIEHAASITIYDHHDMAINKMTEYFKKHGVPMPPDGERLITRLHGKPVTTMFDRSRSGGVIMRDELPPDAERPALLDLIQQIDFETYARPGVFGAGERAKDAFFSKAAYLDGISLAAKDIKTIVAAFDEAAQLSEEELVARGRGVHEKNKAATEAAVENMRWARIPVVLDPNLEPVSMRVPIIAANLQQCGREFIARLRELAQESSAKVALSWFVDDKGIYRVSVRSSGVPSASDVAAYIGNVGLCHGLGGGGTSTSAAAQFDEQQFKCMFDDIVTEAEMKKEMNASRPHAHPHASPSGGGSPLQL